MQQLLSIKSNPIKLEMNITNASLQLNTQDPTYEMTREPGKFTMRSQSAKLNIDTYEARASVTGGSAFDMSRKYAEKGKQAALNATANYAREGDMMADIHESTTAIADIARMKMTSLNEYGLGFLPSAPVELTYEPAKLDIEFERDKLKFDWKVNQRRFEYIPGDIEFTVAEYPTLEIEYIGSPVYVPKSSDPNYKPISVTA